MATEWRRCVAPYGEFYEASSAGEVRLIGKRRRLTKTLRSPYLTVYLGKFKQSIPVARLVLEAFRGPRPKDHVIDHINGRHQDNRISNLEFVTRSENTRRAWKLSRHKFMWLQISIARRKKK
jgi:hypothetical protein